MLFQVPLTTASCLHHSFGGEFVKVSKARVPEEAMVPWGRQPSPQKAKNRVHRRFLSLQISRKVEWLFPLLIPFREQSNETPWEKIPFPLPAVFYQNRKNTVLCYNLYLIKYLPMIPGRHDEGQPPPTDRKANKHSCIQAMPITCTCRICFTWRSRA